MISVNDRLIYANPAVLKMFRAETFEVLAARRPIDLVDPACLGIAEALRRESLITGRGTDYSIIRHTRLDGDKFDAEVACAPVRWAGISCNMVILRDVTGRVKGERELRVSEERHRDLIESGPDAMYVQVAGTIVYMNAACRRLFSLDDDKDYRGRSVLDFVHPDEREKASRSLANFLKTKVPVEFVEQRRMREDGSDFPASVSVRPINWEGEKSALVVLRDISYQKAMEAAREESESRYKNLLEISPDAIYVHREGRIVLINEAGAKLFGSESAEAMVGMQATDLVHPDDRETVEWRQAELRTKNNGLLRVSQKRLRLDGSAFKAEVMATPVEWQ
ncbi:unnamed protein product, partial [Laminaria digitata]